MPKGDSEVSRYEVGTFIDKFALMKVLKISCQKLNTPIPPPYYWRPPIHQICQVSNLTYLLKPPILHPENFFLFRAPP